MGKGVKSFVKGTVVVGGLAATFILSSISESDNYKSFSSEGLQKRNSSGTIRFYVLRRQ